jgi:hypothetical protein
VTFMVLFRNSSWSQICKNQHFIFSDLITALGQCTLLTSKREGEWWKECRSVHS